MIVDLIKQTRSFRRFDQSSTVSQETLKGLVDMARHSASARNLQPLKYVLSCKSETNALIFSTLIWAKDLKNWPGPAEGERPSAYIIVLGDTGIATNFGVDSGIASQNIMLGAREQELGGCIVASIDRSVLRKGLNIPDQYEIPLALAIGKPAETVVIDPLGKDGDTRYWRDDAGFHHVPKRSMEEIILTSDER